VGATPGREMLSRASPPISPTLRSLADPNTQVKLPARPEPDPADLCGAGSTADSRGDLLRRLLAAAQFRNLLLRLLRRGPPSHARLASGEARLAQA
jgi:hypothetical protein